MNVILGALVFKTHCDVDVVIIVLVAPQCHLGRLFLDHNKIDLPVKSFIS